MWLLVNQGKPRGVVELSYKVFNFTEDQDLKLKIGYNAFRQVNMETGPRVFFPFFLFEQQIQV